MPLPSLFGFRPLPLLELLPPLSPLPPLPLPLPLPPLSLDPGLALVGPGFLGGSGSDSSSGVGNFSSGTISGGSSVGLGFGLIGAGPLGPGLVVGPGPVDSVGVSGLGFNGSDIGLSVVGGAGPFGPGLVVGAGVAPPVSGADPPSTLPDSGVPGDG